MIGVTRAATAEDTMRMFIALVVIIYLVGIGVVLSPTISTKWNTATASDLFGSMWLELPGAMSWPVSVYHRVTGTAPSTSDLGPSKP
jgi:hypothetical protein